MKNIYKLSKAGLLAICLSLTACGTEDEIGTELITNYAVITYDGGNPMFVNVGAPFEETAIATIEGNEVPMEASYSGRYRGADGATLNTNVSDVYTASYSAENEEGFIGTQTRQIIVANTGDLVNSIEGVYRATVKRNGAFTAPAEDYTDMEFILIWQNDDGTYEISDAIGGYYDFGRDYGVTYINPGGIIVANDISANDFEFPGTQTNVSFGGSSQITSMTVNPANKTIQMVTVWEADPETTYTFDILLEQVQF